MEKLFGLDIYTKGSENLLKDLNTREDKIHIISGNAEVLKYPLKSKSTFDLFNNSKNYIIPDGISVCIPLKSKKIDVKKITGIDFMKILMKYYEEKGKSVYFLGAKEDVLKEMESKIKVEYPKLKISGSHHGYIDIDNCDDVLNEIKLKSPDAIFVAMGTPMQENFIFKYMDELPANLYMGVGGTFDVLSGKVSRCPKWVSDIGFEWLYRMIKDPSKVNRLWNNLIFTIKGLLVG